jgi:alpha-mannosidase
MTLTIEWQRRIEHWIRVMSTLVYLPLGKVAVSGFTTLKQLTVEQARTAKSKPMPTGTEWGAKWEYGWFQAEVTLPEQARGERIALRMDTGGDGLVWVNGVITGAREWAHTEVTLSKSAVPGEKYQILMESYAGHGPISVGGGPVPDGVESMPEPEPTQEKVGENTFGIWEEDMYQLWVDATTLFELRGKLDEGSLRVSEIDQALMDMTNVVDLELPRKEMMLSVAEGRKRLQPLLKCTNGSTAPTLYAVGHAHLDVAWLWPLQETEHKIGRTVSNQLALMEEYPDYVYIQPQPHLFTMLKQRYPDLYERMLARVKTGQFITDGGAWVEPDTNITGGESLVRQFMHGKRFFKEEFGVDCEHFWEPDVFGYSGAVPQIMLGCGLKYFSTQKILWAYNGGDPFPYNQFIWEGIDGSEVLAHIYLGYGNETSPKHVYDNWMNRNQKQDVSTALLIFGWGDGGGGPTRNHLEFLKREGNLEGLPKVKMASPIVFFKDMEKRINPKNRFVGELYFQAHRGTYTSQAMVKKGNRKSEWALREAELWGVAARSLAGYDLPLSTLDESWKVVLLNHFHDILPGSSIARVYEEASKMHSQVIATGQALAQKAASTLTWRGKGLTVFNSLNWVRKMLVCLPEGVQGAVDALGQPIVVQEAGGKLMAEASVPACGWTSLIFAEPQGKTPAVIKASKTLLENEYLRVKFNANGEVISLVDKETGREMMSAPGNRFLMFKDIPDWFDAWDIDSMYKESPVELEPNGEVELISSGPLFATLRLKRHLHASDLVQEIRLRRGSRTLEFTTTIEWCERHKLLKVSFPFNVHANEALHEIQFGHIRRPNHASKPFDADRFEVCNHKWSAMMEENRGAAVLNDSKYGINVVGGTMNLTLLKSALSPDMHADLGTQQFTYGVCIWNGSLYDSPVVKDAYEMNAPSTITKGLSEERSLFTTSAANIIIETVKPAEDGSKDIIIRMYESKHSATHCRLTTTLAVDGVFETNMLEDDGKKLSFKDGKVELDFRAFEIKTLRLKTS